MAITLESFLAALAQQESGNSYTARNPESGAYGKYQILESNWPAWAAEAGIPGAAPTPENQERVARFKIQQYFNRYGNWEDVAAVWYSGQPLGPNADSPQGNYPSIRQYVNSVITRAGGTPMQGGGNMPGNDFYTRYATAVAKRNELLRRWTPLAAKFESAVAAGAVYDPDLGLVVANVDPSTGQQLGKPRVFMSPEEYQTYFSLDQELGNVEAEIDELEIEYEQGGDDLDEFIRRQEFLYSTDPRNIDAQNAAERFGREMDVRTSAIALANQQLREQNQVQQEATDDFNRFMTTNSFGTVFRAPRTHLPTADDLFQRAVESVKKGLPEVPDRPYYEDRSLPPPRPKLSEIRGSILNEPENNQVFPPLQATPHIYGPGSGTLFTFGQRTILDPEPDVISRLERQRAQALLRRFPLPFSISSKRLNKMPSLQSVIKTAKQQSLPPVEPKRPRKPQWWEGYGMR